MAISQAQAFTNQQFDNVDTGAVTYGSSTTTGNLFVCSVWAYSTGGALGVSAVSDNKSNTWTRRAAGGFESADQTAAIYDVVGTGGASHQVTVDPVGTGNYFNAQVWELTGQGASPFGGTAGTHGTSSTPATGNLSANSAAGDFQIAVIAVSGGAVTVVLVDVYSPVYTQAVEETDGNNHDPGEADYRIQTGVTNGGCSWTFGGLSYRWSCATANYVAAVAGGTVPGSMVNGGLANRGLINAGLVN